MQNFLLDPTDQDPTKKRKRIYHQLFLYGFPFSMACKSKIALHTYQSEDLRAQKLYVSSCVREREREKFKFSPFQVSDRSSFHEFLGRLWFTDTKRFENSKLTTECFTYVVLYRLLFLVICAGKELALRIDLTSM